MLSLSFLSFSSITLVFGCCIGHRAFKIVNVCILRCPSPKIEKEKISAWNIGLKWTCSNQLDYYYHYYYQCYWTCWQLFQHNKKNKKTSSKNGISINGKTLWTIRDSNYFRMPIILIIFEEIVLSELNDMTLGVCVSACPENRWHTVDLHFALTNIFFSVCSSNEGDDSVQTHVFIGSQTIWDWELKVVILSYACTELESERCEALLQKRDMYFQNGIECHFAPDSQCSKIDLEYSSTDNFHKWFYSVYSYRVHPGHHRCWLWKMMWTESIAMTIRLHR